MLPLFDVTNTSRGVLLSPHFNCAVALITTVGFGIKMGWGNGDQLQVAALEIGIPIKRMYTCTLLRGDEMEMVMVMGGVDNLGTLNSVKYAMYWIET